MASPLRMMVVRPVAVFSFGVIRCAPSPNIFGIFSPRRFSPSAASLRYSSSSGGDDLSSHLRKLVISDAGLGEEDAVSIKLALSRSKIREMLNGYGSTDEDQARRFALESIDDYIDMKQSTETEVDDAGALVKLIMSIKLNKALETNELRTECLVALAGVDEATAEHAVRVYLGQKKRRETSGLSKIAVSVLDYACLSCFCTDTHNRKLSGPELVRNGRAEECFHPCSGSCPCSPTA